MERRLGLGIRRVVVVGVALAVIAGLLAVSPGPVLAQDGGVFDDVAEDAYYSEPVEVLAGLGVFGVTLCDGGFCPGELIDRKTMAVWTVRVLDGGDPPAVSGTRFDDVDPDGFYAPFVERMAQLGVTSGCGDGSGFCPDRVVTRAQMAVFLSRAFGLPEGGAGGFGDVAADAWYAAGVGALALSGITSGCGDGTRFCPADNTKRAQMATFLYRGLRWAEDRDAAAELASRAELGSVPGVVTVTAYLGRVAVSWPATDALPQSAAAGYEVRWRPSGGVWDNTERRAVVVGLSYEIGGLDDGQHDVQVRRAVVEQDEVGGASIVSGEGSAPRATLVTPTLPVGDERDISTFGGGRAVDFEMTGIPVWPATIEIPVDMTEVDDTEFVFLMSFNEELGVWLPEPGAVFDTERGVITAEVYHLSLWSAIKTKASKAIDTAFRISTGVGIRRVSSFTGDVVIDKIARLAVNAAKKVGEGAKYVYDKTKEGVVYLSEKGIRIAVNTLEKSRDAAVEIARMLWEAAKFVAAVNWELLVKLVEDWVDQITVTVPVCDGTTPEWVTGVEVPQSGTPLKACAEAVDITSGQDLRLKVASQVLYPIQLTARDSAGDIRISPNNQDTGRLHLEQTKGPSTLGALAVAWLDRAFGTGGLLLPSTASHWLRIPRSALDNPPGMILEGKSEILAHNLNTLLMAVDLLADMSGVPVSSDDVTALQASADDASKCLPHIDASAIGPNGRSRLFRNTYKCLSPITHRALTAKVHRALLGPVTFALQGVLQLGGYLQAGWDAATRQDSATITINTTPNDPTTTTHPNGADQLVAGPWHMCAIATDQTVTCWGRNDAPTGTYKQLAAGAAHTCATATDNTITCWGNNPYGQTDAPVGQYKQLAAGAAHTCATATDNTITCWGDNRYGQTDPPAGTYKHVAAGEWHTCAIATDNTITCWGDNRYGKADAPAGTYKHVAAGEWHTCAIATDNTITCWGNNAHGQSTAPTGTYKQLMVSRWLRNCAIATDDTVTCWGNLYFRGPDDPAGTYKQVAAGEWHNCAIATDNTITCWGDDAPDAPAGQYKHLAAAMWHFCAIATDNTIACWGNNRYGQLDDIPTRL